MKEEMLLRLKKYESNLKSLRKQIKELKKERVNRKELMILAEELSKAWFDQFQNQLGTLFKIPNEILEKYRGYFDRLMKLSSPNNRKSSYTGVLDNICKKFKSDLIIPVQQFSLQVVSKLDLVNIIKDIPDIEEKKYMNEAVDCANHSFRLASIVMGWCAAIDHIHRKIEKIGFQKFNQASINMKDKTSGRFKKFNKSYNISSISELREIFDRDVIWILEGMGLIDNNENKRLIICFEMRNDCAHPGEAPIKDPNLMSFFSDITEIVLKNPKFKLI